jgi:hypothetical protein
MMPYAPSAEEQATSWRHLRRRLFLDGRTSRIDADMAELRRVLLAFPGVRPRIEDGEDVAAIALHVGNGAVWAARQVLEDAG